MRGLEFAFPSGRTTAMIFLVGRDYHYPTDTIGGLGIVIAVVSCIHCFATRRQRHARRGWGSARRSLIERTPARAHRADMTVVRPHASSEAPHRTTPREGSAPLPAVRVGSVIAAVALALGLLEILWLGVVLDAGLAVVDPLVTGWLASTRPQLLARVAGIVTTVGGPGPMSVLLAMAVAVLSWRRGTAWPVAVGAGGLAALTLIDLGVKVAVARPRPPEAWRAVAAAGWSSRRATRCSRPGRSC